MKKGADEAMLEIKNLYRSFPGSGSVHPVIRDLSFSVKEQDFYVILGQSGCGKSTLLRLIGGFDKPDSGQILLDGKEVTKPSKDMMMVFQSFDQLFPWHTLKGNLIYAMKKVRIPVPEEGYEGYALRYLEMAGLGGFENSYPHQLSGGMKQRGALARALCLKPRVLLMDEPFSSLDYVTKRNAYQNIRHMAKQTGCTIIMVTHDIDEALLLGTTVAVFSKETLAFHKVMKVEAGDGPDRRPELERYLLG